MYLGSQFQHLVSSLLRWTQLEIQTTHRQLLLRRILSISIWYNVRIHSRYTLVIYPRHIPDMAYQAFFGHICIYPGLLWLYSVYRGARTHPWYTLNINPKYIAVGYYGLQIKPQFQVNKNLWHFPDAEARGKGGNRHLKDTLLKILSIMLK